jgi:competence protein ComEA
MKEMLRDFFSFSSLERKGIVVLIILILVITCLNFYLVHHEPEVDHEAQTRFMKDLHAFEQHLSLENGSSDLEAEYTNENLAMSTDLFFFDPNEASAADLRRIGLNSRVIGNLVNYRKHGGRFYCKEDLQKIYGMTGDDYARLSPWIAIPETYKRQAPADKPTVSPCININLADSSDFERLPGIGRVLARRILRYRSLLGGFYDTGQLMEVYGISDSLYVLISHNVYADTTHIRKINLNEAGENDLARHPYIGKHTARGIIRYRAKVHTIKSFHELTVNGLITIEVMEKLEKYLFI